MKNHKLMDYRDYTAIVLTFLSSVSSIIMLIMIIQHVYLISSGKTTNECIRKKYAQHVFDKGCSGNWKRACLLNDTKGGDSSKEVELSIISPS